VVFFGGWGEKGAAQLFGVFAECAKGALEVGLFECLEDERVTCGYSVFLEGRFLEKGIGHFLFEDGVGSERS